MLRPTLLATILVAAALFGFGSFALAGASSEASEPTPIVREWDGFLQVASGARSIEEPLIWSIVAVAGGAIVGGTLYLLKRQVGGFPANPDWVAPITIMPAEENAVEEEDFPPPPADHH